MEKGAGTSGEAVAHVWFVRNGQLLEQPVATLSTNNLGDAGVQSLIVDPSFEINHYFYVWYATGVNSVQWSGQSVYRLSRFTFDPLTKHVVPGSEAVILDGIPISTFHNGGAMAFDDTGNLYVATGDIAQYEIAQDLSSLSGKLLRIHPEEDGYSIPSANPFVGIPGARDEIYAYGFRNPFRMVRRSTDGTLLLADVGDLTWEEVNRIVPGANYGWPIREGPCPLGERKPCSPASPEYTDPVLYYEHVPGEGGSVTGLAVYEGDAFPESYQETVFFADFSQRFLGAVDAKTLLSEPAASEKDVRYIAEDVGPFVDIEYYKGSLYVVDIFAGAVQKLSYDPRPTVDISAEPSLGNSPLTVTVSAEATTAPETDSVVYRWDFGDGSPVTFTLSPNVTHTYTADGTCIAGVRVIDDALRASEPASTTVTVYSGELPRINLTNQTDPLRSRARRRHL